MVTLKKRPTSVTVIGWIFIVMAIYSIVTSGMGLLRYSFLAQMKDEPLAQDPIYKMVFAKMTILSHPLLLSFIIISSIVSLVASINFFKLRPWARTTLEVIAWLYAVYTVGTHLLFLIPMMNYAWSQPPANLAPFQSPEFKVYSFLIASVSSLMWALPTIIIIYFLRKRSLREAFTPSPG